MAGYKFKDGYDLTIPNQAREWLREARFGKDGDSSILGFETESGRQVLLEEATDAQILWFVADLMERH